MKYTSIIIPFVGGLGMFIYGMQIMAQGLENAAGNRMKSLLEALTKNKFFGVLLGAFITAVIQSSSATTVMDAPRVRDAKYTKYTKRERSCCAGPLSFCMDSACVILCRDEGADDQTFLHTT